MCINKLQLLKLHILNSMRYNRPPKMSDAEVYNPSVFLQKTEYIEKDGELYLVVYTPRVFKVKKTNNGEIPECIELDSSRYTSKDRPRLGSSLMARALLEIKICRPLKKEMLACHCCHNPLCINVDHLREDNHESNMFDTRGRKPLMSLSGEANPRYKLSDHDIDMISDQIKNGETINKLANTYNVDRSTINRIKNGKRKKTDGKLIQKINIKGSYKKRDELNNGNAKIDVEMAKEIIAQASNKKSKKQIADDYGISEHLVYKICQKKHWTAKYID